MTILRVLTQSGGKAKLDGLVHAIAEEETDFSSIKPTEKSLKTSLLTSHLPKLEGAGLVTYDHHTESISLNTLPPALHTHFESLLLSLYDLLRTSERN